jgi:hypothetical protein
MIMNNVFSGDSLKIFYRDLGSRDNADNNYKPFTIVSNSDYL